MIDRLRRRQEWAFFGALRRASPGHAVAWWVGLVRAGVAAGGDRRGVGLADRGRHRRRAADRPARGPGRRVRRRPGRRPAARGARLDARRPHGDVAQRPPDGGDARPAGRRPPRAGRPHRRPVDGPRLRPRHHRTAAVVRHELHRRRVRRRWSPASPRPSCSPGTAGGRRSCSCSPGRRPTGCCARAPSGAIAARRRSSAPSATPSTPTASRSTRRRPRRCACSASPTGSSSASPRSAGASTTCSTRRPGCASGRCSAACVIVLGGQRAWRSGRSPTGPPTGGSTWRRRSSPCRPRSASARSPSAGSTGRSTGRPRRSPRWSGWSR